MDSESYSTIPETGGALRSPIRDDYIKLVIGVIERDPESFLDERTTKTLQQLYTKGIKWRHLLVDTLAIFSGYLINPVSHDWLNKMATESTAPLAGFASDYLRSLGVKITEEKEGQIKKAIEELDITRINFFGMYLSIQILVANVEKLRSHGILQGYYECDKTFSVGTSRIFDGFLIMEWNEKCNNERVGSLFSYDGLLSIRDVLLKRSIAILLSICKFEFLGSSYPSYGTVKTVIAWGDEVLCNGNEYYSTIASYESILTGVIIDKHDTFRNNEFLDRMVSEVAIVSQRVRRATEDMVKALGSESASTKVQCFALFKLWSFPTVDEEEAMRTLISYGKYVKHVDQDAMMNIVAKGRKLFFTSYVRLHNRLPAGCIYTGDDGDYLMRVVCGEVYFRENYTENDYNPLDWNNVAMRGVIEPIFNADIGSYMKDKAISPELDELWQVYQKEYIPECVRSSGGKSVRSGILRYIKGDIISAWALVEYVEKFGADKAWQVVGVTAKEKEHKPSARLFAMLVLQMKLWFAVTEDCLKKALFKYFPQQSMDQTSAQAFAKKYHMSSKSSSSYFKIIMNIDFSKWNTTFRNENTFLVFLFIDELFDFERVYTYTHQFFKTCRVYLSSRYTVPKSLIYSRSHEESIDPGTQDNLWFYGFLGGFEGQRQKGWTLVTLLFMVYVMEDKVGLKNYQLYGQGDNQVVEINIRKSDWNLEDEAELSDCEDDVHKLIDRIRQELVNGCNELGLKVKAEETWFSSSFFQYSKDFYIDGARMPLDMKQLLALSPHNKLIVPTQFEIYKMMVSTVNACFDSSHSCLATYFIGMYISNLLILVDDHVYDRRPEIKFDDIYTQASLPVPERLIRRGGNELLEMMSKIPSSLGGTCDILLSNLVRKGKGDFVEGAVDSVIRSSCKKCLSYLHNLQRYGMQDSFKTDKSILLINNLSVNLRIEEQDGDTLKSAVIRYLEEKAGGPVKTALEDFTSPMHKAFKRSLINEGDDYNPVLATIIYELSVFAAVQSQMEKVDGATMNRMAGVNLQSFMHRVSEINRKKIEFFKLQSVTLLLTNPDVLRNSREFAASLRSFWCCGELSLPIGRMMPNMYIKKGDESPADDPSMLLSYTGSSLVNYLNSSRGSERPLPRVTNQTEARTTGIKIPHGRIKSSLESLADILPVVCDKGSKLHSDIKRQIKSVTDFDIDCVVDWTSTKEVRLLETSDVPTASNFQTHCKFIFSDRVKRNILTSDERFEIEKVKHASVSLTNLQMLLNPDDDVSTFWIVFKKQSEIRGPTKNFSFSPSSITYPNSHLYYVKKEAGIEYETNRSRRTDDVLSITMLIDAALAEEEFSRLNGVPRRPLPSMILTYDARLVFLIFTARMMISQRMSMFESTDSYSDFVNSNEERLSKMFKQYLTDEGLQSLTNSEVGYHTRLRKRKEIIRVTIMAGFHQLNQIFESSFPLFLRLIVLYELNPIQLELLEKDTLSFLSRSGECGSTLEAVHNRYGAVMTHYGKKTFNPLLPRLRKVKVEMAPIAYTTDSQEAFTGQLRNPTYIRVARYQSIGFYQCLFSLVSGDKYSIIVIHDIPKAERATFANSAAYTSFAKLLQSRKFETRSGCTIIFRLDEKLSIVGKHKLSLENILLRGGEDKDISHYLGVPVLHVGTRVEDYMFEDDWMIIDDQPTGNIFSFFTDCVTIIRADDRKGYKFLNKSFNIKLHFPDWCLRYILYEEMKILTQGRYTGRINKRDMCDYFDDNGIDTERRSEIEDHLGPGFDSSRIFEACKSIHRARLQVISDRMGLRFDELERMGNFDYDDEVAFSEHLSQLIEFDDT